MKRLIISVASAGLLVAQAFAAPQQTTSTTNISSKEGRLSYTLGVDIGTNFKKLDVTLDPSLVAQGIQDINSGKEPRISQKEMQDTMVQFQKEMIAKKENEFKKMSVDNAKAGQMFLAKNKKETGVVTLDNGLQYKVLEKGTGLKPTANDQVTVNYEGKTVEGKVFDSSFKRGQPVTFAVKDVIPAWSQALQMMQTGATWMVYAPASLAYGERGIGPIGPNETLIFKINLVSINKDKKDVSKK